MMATATTKKPFVARANATLTAEEIAAVRVLVAEHGLNGAARRLGPVHRATLSSMLAGLPVTLGNAVLVRLRLAELAATT